MMSDRQYPRLRATPRAADEPFRRDGDPLGLTVGEFWRWAMSDLISNTTRGLLAEFIVARALGATEEVRETWDPYDVRTPDGIAVEVKSSAYVQSWHQSKKSIIKFDIPPTKAWDNDNGTYASESKRQAAVYVFAVLKEDDQARLDPLDLDQWAFYVIATRTLGHARPGQKSIVLNSLKRAGAVRCDHAGLPETVRNAATGSDD